MAPPKQQPKDRPFLDRLFVLCGLVSAWFSIQAIRDLSPEITGSDQFLAVMFWCFAFFIHVVTAPKPETL